MEAQPNPPKLKQSHVNNRMANYKLNILFDGAKLKHNEDQGVTQDSGLISHFQNPPSKDLWKGKDHAQCATAGSTWGACAKVLCTSTLPLVYTTAKYRATVWLSSVHVREVDKQLKRT